ncbi:hypothetical protein [Nocardia aurantiaca]|uniref:Uncharacterized protein n=1 Tax=Nocardia aurantiaca TaxID=2675850 RepID=A0A6I3KYV9_9NOCA|nr:hypothetical protein [Nocardia aurantiaca]MTE14158.1 hypothetical protein [Nocardia aurantiaca]
MPNGTEPHGATVSNRKSAVANPKKRTTKPKRTITNADSLEAFLQELFESIGKFKAVELSQSVRLRAVLMSAADLSEFDALLRRISARDLRATMPVELLRMADLSSLRDVSRHTVAGIAARLLTLHPLFVDDQELGEAVGTALSDRADATSLGLLVAHIRKIVAYEGKAVLKPTEHEPKKKTSLTLAELETLRDNAVGAAILLTASSLDWDRDNMVDFLAEHVWSAYRPTDDRSTAYRAQLVSAHPDARRLAAIAMASTLQRLTAAESKLDAAERRAKAANTRLSALEEELKEATKRIAELDMALFDTRHELQRTVDAHHGERMRESTEFKQLRVRSARVVTTQVDTLGDALDALEHGHPQVATEFIKDSVQALQKTLWTLRSEPHDPQGEPA